MAPSVSFAPDAEKPEELTKTKSYALVASPSGVNLFVEAPEYDPLAPHRKDDQEHNQGEGLGALLLSCFGCCGRAAPAEPKEPAATADRHYSLPQSESMVNLIEHKGD
ncbi:MAG: hypothetical protein J3K34DRAFT_515926 [Monoraphidium minutum]|nr:MAG: hypothetical protein J3K34DRAFT_515926 [Monoraphidium minutum]